MLGGLVDLCHVGYFCLHVFPKKVTQTALGKHPRSQCRQTCTKFPGTNCFEFIPNHQISQLWQDRPCLLQPASAAETGSLTQHIPPAMWDACFLLWKSSKYCRNSILGIHVIVSCWFQIQFTPFTGKGCFFLQLLWASLAVRLEQFLFKYYHW